VHDEAALGAAVDGAPLPVLPIGMRRPSPWVRHALLGVVVKRHDLLDPSRKMFYSLALLLQTLVMLYPPKLNKPTNNTLSMDYTVSNPLDVHRPRYATDDCIIIE
jgi:hypothetical protein